MDTKVIVTMPTLDTTGSFEIVIVVFVLFQSLFLSSYTRCHLKQLTAVSQTMVCERSGSHLCRILCVLSRSVKYSVLPHDSTPVPVLVTIKVQYGCQSCCLLLLYLLMSFSTGSQQHEC